MKKIGVLLGIVLLLSLSVNSFAKDRRLTKGFSVNLITGFPSSSYGDFEDTESPYQYGTLWGVEVGNRWYFSPKETFGVGLMVNWFDFTMAAKGGTDANFGDWGRATLDISFIEVGPVGTLAISENAAIDGYYNLRPTVQSTAFVLSNATDDTYTAAGFGFSHALGAAFRVKVFNLGFEYVLGSIKCKETYSGNLSGLDAGNVKNKTNSFRIKIGVKF